ncbi:AAA family ATPase [Mucilaginibacter sp. FT3.2]|uniref:AAA family ATPase n=1 Tax=Mucilaginibacter sp. FT3.2 TaxID=2723090 RepID=UPI00161857C4|nr:AAA family ATPase [Mucilaginibacter sp. FT3.2]MBB6231103.1 HTH-type transcriptional repressor of NAD biosynthesis genes [Mucilaginibacter sp. FT3.2]
MKRGLVIGKFMPLHKGHIALIDFALEHCDELIVLVSASYDEPIWGSKRLEWVKESYKENSKVSPWLLNYDEAVLPNTPASSDGVSRIWANYLQKELPQIDIIFASEPYGAYMSRFLDCESMIFDEPRKLVPVSANQIREKPFAFWNYLAEAAKPYFTKKVCVLGTESTGKTTMVKRLAHHFHTLNVPEMGHDILERTNDCTEDDLLQIAQLHARTINEKLKEANKILFVDTDLNTTRSYSHFLFDKDLLVPEWVETANHFDLYIYLNVDAPYVQNGTRLSKEDRNRLDESHKQELASHGIHYVLIEGDDWDERFEKAGTAVVQFIKKGSA